MPPLIVADNLRKTYRIRQQRPGLRQGIRALFRPEYVTLDALDGITFAVEPGVIAGLVGSNGAGKSTLVKLLVGIMRRDGGHLSVNGQDPFANRMDYVRRIGVVFGQRSNLLWDLSVAESFDLHRTIFGVTQSDYLRRLGKLTEIFDLGSILHQPARTLSLGQTMRCAVAQVLLQEPDILFLDEPTIGLDVVSVERLGITLRHLNRTLNTTVVIASHDLSVIESNCNQVIMLHEGRILFNGTETEAKQKYGRYRKLRFVFPDHADMDGAMALLRGKGLTVTREGLELTGLVDAETRPINTYVTLFEELSRTHHLLEFFVERPSLKEVILHAFQ